MLRALGGQWQAAGRGPTRAPRRPEGLRATSFSNRGRRPSPLRGRRGVGGCALFNLFTRR